MRILYHHRTLSEDGQAVHIRALLQAFRAEGHAVEEVSLVQRSQPAGAAAAAEPPAWKRAAWGLVARLPRAAHELAEYAYAGVARPRLAGAAARFRPDFLYERYAFGNTAGVLAARRAGVPLVLEVNSPMVLELSRTRGLSFPRLADRVERFVFTGAGLVCAVTEVLAGMLAELGVARERLLVTPNGVHLEQYDPAPAPARRAAARAALGLAEGGPVLGFVGYYRDWHRLDLAVECLREPALADARLVLVGAGPAEEGLAALAGRLGVAERVRFAGPRAHGEIPGLLAAFDVALVPAINPYASPLKLHEYMAAGLPVVAPDQPNLREVLADGENGLLVRPGDGAALLAALERLVGDGALAADLGRAARRTIEERDLTWRGNARRVVAAVEDLRR